MSNSRDNVERLRTVGLICDGSRSPLGTARGVNYWLDYATDNPGEIWTIVTPDDITFNQKAVIPRNVNLRHVNRARWIWTGLNTGVAVETNPADVIRENVFDNFSLAVNSGFEGKGFLMHSCADVMFTGRLTFEMQGTTSIAMEWAADSTGGDDAVYNRNTGSVTIDKLKITGSCGEYIRSSGVSPGYNGSPQVVTLNVVHEMFGLGGAKVCAINIINWTDNVSFGLMNRSLIDAVNAKGAMIGATSAQGVYAIRFGHYAVDSFGGPFAGRVGFEVGEAKLVQVDALYQNPIAEAGEYRLAEASRGVALTLIKDSTAEIITDSRDLRFANQVPASSTPFVIADEEAISFSVKQLTPDLQNLFFTLDLNCSDPLSSGVFNMHCRVSTGTAGDIGASWKAEPLSTTEIVLGVGSMTTGVFTDQYGNAISDGQFHVHSATDGRIYLMNRRGSTINGVITLMSFQQVA